MSGLIFTLTIEYMNSVGEQESHEITVEGDDADEIGIGNWGKVVHSLHKDAIRRAVMDYFDELCRRYPEKRREIDVALTEQILPQIDMMEK